MNISHPNPSHFINVHLMYEGRKSGHRILNTGPENFQHFIHIYICIYIRHQQTQTDKRSQKHHSKHMGIAGKQMAHKHRRVIKQSVGMGGIKKGSHPEEEKGDTA